MRATVWVGEADGLPYKLVVVGKILSLSDTGETSFVETTTTTLIEIDPTIVITAPTE